MGETDEELRARIEARINARRDQMTNGEGGDPADIVTTPKDVPPSESAADPGNPMADQQILEPSRGWSAPQVAPEQTGSAPAASDGPSASSPWLTGTAPSVREAQQRAVELGMQDHPVGTAASLRPRRPWLKDSDQRANDSTERPEARRTPASFVPEEQAEIPQRGAQTRRERREQRRAEKAQEKAAAKSYRDSPTDFVGAGPLAGAGPIPAGDTWTTPTYGLPSTGAPVFQTPLTSPPTDVAPAVEPTFEPPVHDPYLPPHPKYAADAGATPVESAVAPAAESGVAQPAAEATAWTPSEFAPPPSWGPPTDTQSMPAEPAAAVAPDSTPSDGPLLSFPTLDLPSAPAPPMDFRAELAALRAQIADLAQELSSAPISPAPSNDSGGLFRRTRSPEQGADDAS